jgi:hypothetical protein
MLQNLLYLLFLAQALLPWVTGSFSVEEKEAMMGSLREAITQCIANFCVCTFAFAAGAAALGDRLIQ